MIAEAGKDAGFLKPPFLTPHVALGVNPRAHPVGPGDDRTEQKLSVAERDRAAPASASGSPSQAASLDKTCGDLPGRSRAAFSVLNFSRACEIRGLRLQ